MPIKLGIIGAGSIAALHARGAAAAGSEIVGFCDLEEKRAAALARAYEVSSGTKRPTLVTTSADELLAADLDAVVVALPNFLHKDMAIKALRAGRDVLLEKPMAMNIGECDEIIAAIEESGRLLQVNFVCRCTPTTAFVSRLVESGKLGTIYHAKASVYRRREIPGLGRWFTNKAQSGGGVLIDLGVHLIDLVMHLTGYPAARRASGVCTSIFGRPLDTYAFTDMWAGPPDPRGTFDVEDGATALIRYEGGLTLELNTTWAANLPEKVLPDGVTLLGDRGGCFFDIWGDRVTITTEEAGLLIDAVPKLGTINPWDSSWRDQHAVFAGHVTNRTQPTASAANGRQVQAILDALYRSSAAGEEVGV